jgi:nucleoporin SEH1
MPQILSSPHKDFIHDIAFDHYGRRIATCSADHTVKIFDLDENGEWATSVGSGWKAHSSGVTSLSWAHPEFGQLLATSGADGLATVWEERADSGTGSGGLGDANSVFSAQTPTTRWTNRARLTDARKSLSCVKFAPRHYRLQLATASADGVVRIYEAVDVMNLNQWLLKNSIEVEPDTNDLGVRCLDWCQGRFEPPTLVVGDSAGNVNIYRYSDASRNWGLYLKLDGHTNPRRGVLDVAWSPDVGRSYHLISSCGRDGLLRVHRLKKASHNADGMLEVDSSQELNTKDEVWRCSWNVTGTVLASSGDGGVVELWKSDFKGNWKCVSKVKGAL